MQVYFTQTQFSSGQTYVHQQNLVTAQQNYPACTSPHGEREAFNKTIKKQQYKSEVSEWSIPFHLHQYPNSICLVPVFGSCGLFILNSITVIPSLAIVCNYDQMSVNLSQQLLWIPSVPNLCLWPPISPTNKCRSIRVLFYLIKKIIPIDLKDIITTSMENWVKFVQRPVRENPSDNVEKIRKWMSIVTLFHKQGFLENILLACFLDLGSKAEKLFLCQFLRS